MSAYVTIEEFEQFWRQLEMSEYDRFDILEQLAQARLTVMANDAGVDLEARVEEDENYLGVVKWVIMEAIKRAISTPTNTMPVDTYSQTAGPYTENYKFTNPSGDLWFKKSELAALGIANKQTINSIKPSTRGDIYGN